MPRAGDLLSASPDPKHTMIVTGKLLALPAAMLMAVAAAPALAAPVELSANAGVVSDYRFRGISLSDRDPALQGGLDLETEAGFFAGTWASTIADYEGAKIEVDVYAGFAGSAAGLDYSVTAYAYLYPGGENVNYVELQATAERAFGPVTLGIEADFVPDQGNVEGENVYFGASAAAEIPGTGVTARLRGGYEDGFYASKWDWELGLGYTRGPFTASLSYVDSNFGGPLEEGRLGQGGVVASLVANF